MSPPRILSLESPLTRANTSESVNSVLHTQEATLLDWVVLTLLNLSEQLLALNTQCPDPI